jgi:hypothetical protein
MSGTVIVLAVLAAAFGAAVLVALGVVAFLITRSGRADEEE